MSTPLSDIKAVRLFTATEIRTLDRLAIAQSKQPSARLMRRAGQALFATIQRVFPDIKSISLYCGKGNNAGDGYVLAGIAANHNYQVEVLSTQSDRLSGDAAIARAWCLEQQVNEVNAAQHAPAGDLIVDALLGVGIRGQPDAPYAAAIEAINAADKPVLAVDLPSGLDASTGAVAGAVVRADITLTFIGVKRGLVTGQGPNCAGTLYFDALETPATVYAEGPAGIAWLRWHDLPPMSPRLRTSHKGMFGHALLIGGTTGLGGAVLLAAQAALRSGVGLLSLVTDQEHLSPMLARQPEVMVQVCANPASLVPLLERATVVACGPGLGKGVWAEQMLEAMLVSEQPLILDADALNLLAEKHRPLARYAPTMITPHPVEAARLLHLSVKDVEKNRYHAAGALARLLSAWVVLKGAGSVLAAPDGSLLGVCGHGNPGMATGGMGDVLTGLMLGLWSQLKDPRRALEMAVCAHSLAADNLALEGEVGMLASDMPNAIRNTLNDIDANLV